MTFRNSCALAGWLFLAGLAAAQSVPGAPVTTPVALTAVSTALVGFTASQTIELNVVNLSAVPATATPAIATTACEVQLAFYDGQNRLLKQGLVANIGPGMSTSLSMTRGDVAAASVSGVRVSARGQVSTLATPSASMAAASGPAIIVAACIPVVSLEVYDTISGVTQIFTSDTRAVLSGGAVPLAVGVAAAR